MNRQEKQHIIDSLKHDFQNAQASFIVNIQGLTVSALQQLRRQVYAKEGHVIVAKNTLLIKATDGMEGYDGLQPYFKDQIAIVFTNNQAPAVAKILAQATKEHEKLKLKAGTLDARVISFEQIEFLASLPSREVLLGRLAGTLQAPIVNYVRILNQLIIRLLWVLNEIEKKKQA